MSIELKPCPFCGSDSITNHDTLIGYSVGCDKCGAVAAHCATKAESISAWNTRTAIQQAESAEAQTKTDVRCEGCGYMTHHREHMGCVRAAKQFTHPSPGVPDAAIDSAIYNQCPDFDDWHEGPSIDDIRAIVRTAIQQAESEPAAWGWAIVDNKGLERRTRARIQDFFGSTQEAKPFSLEDVAREDREFAGCAPHRVITLFTRPAPGVPVGQAPSVWNSIQIASWIGSQLMREPSMFERNAVCKFVRSLGRHPTLLKHSPKDTHHDLGVPEDVAQDAQRYRWLRRKACVIGKTTYCGEETGQPILDFVNLPDVTEVIRRDSASTLDAAIDAAMLAAQSQKGK